MIFFEYNNQQKVLEIEKFVSNIAKEIFNDEPYNIKVVLLENGNYDGECSEEGKTIFLLYKQLRSVCLNNQKNIKLLNRMQNKSYMKIVIHFHQKFAYIQGKCKCFLLDCNLHHSIKMFHHNTDIDVNLCVQIFLNLQLLHLM